jgi:DNA topoisomerase III
VITNKRYVTRPVLDGATRVGPQLPRVVCHREMSVEEIAAFFAEAGKTEILDGFISKRGRPFRGALFRKPTGRHGFEFPPREKRAPKKPTAKGTATARGSAKGAAGKTPKKGSSKGGKTKGSTVKAPAAPSTAKDGARSAPGGEDAAT